MLQQECTRSARAGAGSPAHLHLHVRGGYWRTCTGAFLALILFVARVDAQAPSPAEAQRRPAPPSDLRIEPAATEKAPAIANPPQGQITAEPTAADSGYQETPYIVAARIESITPLVIEPGGTLIVDLSVTRAQPITARRLGETLRVLLDSQLLEPADAPSVPMMPVQEAADVEPSAATRAPSSSVAEDRVARVSVFAKVPERLPGATNLAGTRDVVVTVYSPLDGRNVASEVAKFVDPGESGGGLSTFGWTLIVGVGLAAIAVLSWYLRQRQVYYVEIQKLQQVIRDDRARAQDLPASVTTSVATSSTPSGLPEIPPGLTQHITQSELVIVLGEGATAQAGLLTGSSLWTVVLEALGSQVPERLARPLLDLARQPGATGVVDTLLQHVSRGQVLSALAEQLEIPEAHARFDFHERLVSLVNLGVREFIDLTWDRATVLVLAEHHPALPVFTGVRHDGLVEALRSHELFVLKAYGDIGTPQDVALTQQEFRRQLARSPDLQRVLASLYSTRSLLFIGMQPKDIEQLLASLPPEIESADREHFALMPSDWDIALWSEGFARRLGIDVLSYPSTNDGLTRTLDRIIERARMARPAAAAGAEQSAMLSGFGKVRQVQLRNIGNFTALDLDLDDGWNLLLGDNGGGKSTILRAITLALAGNDERGEAMAARLLRNDQREGSIEVVLSTGTRLHTSLIRDGARVQVMAPVVTPLQAGQGLVLAFPALRGVTTTQPTGPSKMAVLNPSVDDVAPLLQERVDTRLNQLKQWVINTELQAETAPQSREARMLETFRKVVREVVPGRQVEYKGVDRSNWIVWLKTQDGDVSFDALSQGTSSILSWVGVLLQRLYDIYPRAQNPEEGMALVLIDEIDAHLHPRWQRKLVALARGVFKNIQMVASSHSPLLAGAMARTELRLVERDPASGQMQAKSPREDLRGQKVEDILTSSLFDLPTTRNPEAEDKIAEYFTLFENANRTAKQDVRLRELETQLDRLNYGLSQAARQHQKGLQATLEQQVSGIPEEMAKALSAHLGSGPPKRRADETTES